MAGRNTMYRTAYRDKMLRYFKSYLNLPPHALLDDDTTVITRETNSARATGYPTMAKFAVIIGVCPDTLLNWCENNASFAEAYRTCKEIERNVVIEGGLTGKFNPSVVCKLIDLQSGGRGGRAGRDEGSASGAGAVGIDGIEINIYDRHKTVEIAEKTVNGDGKTEA